MSTFLHSWVNPHHLPQAFIFDIDGTLYSQTKLRLLMILEMSKVLLWAPPKAADLKIVWNFRKIREKNRDLATWNLEEEQYEWAAKVSGVSASRVRRVVQEWMYVRPLPYLARCRYRGVRELFTLLRDQGIRVGIFSDFPAHAKLEALGLEADVVVTATRQEVSRLKPHPKGLLLTATELNTPIKACLFIGDQDDKDGECARRAGMPYIIQAPRNRDRLFNELKQWVNKCTGYPYT
jgi:HAD superfamily hydrolase (TIGR01549 family)